MHQADAFDGVLEFHQSFFSEKAALTVFCQLDDGYVAIGVHFNLLMGVQLNWCNMIHIKVRCCSRRLPALFADRPARREVVVSSHRAFK